MFKLKESNSHKAIFAMMCLIILMLLAMQIYNAIVNTDFLSLVETEKRNNSTVVLERISKIWELASTKYYYSNVITYKESKKFNNIDIPFTEKGFLIKYDGYIKAGIDINNIKILSLNKNHIKLEIPKSKILDHVIDEKSVYVYDEKNSIFNGLSVKDVFGELSKEKVKIESNFVEKGFLNEANKNTKLFLESVLKDIGYDKVEIVNSLY